ncbi:hypothetical protein BV20DRAFT_743377 [Pilatotrama ljubarskyi]|nr:hypothetical protein BV20DRAFT_743377 [Pilatotrama ljubarskyi]
MGDTDPTVCSGDHSARCPEYQALPSHAEMHRIASAPAVTVSMLDDRAHASGIDSPARYACCSRPRIHVHRARRTPLATDAPSVHAAELHVVDIHNTPSQTHRLQLDECSPTQQPPISALTWPVPPVPTSPVRPARSPSLESSTSEHGKQLRSHARETAWADPSSTTPARNILHHPGDFCSSTSGRTTAPTGEAAGIPS